MALDPQLEPVLAALPEIDVTQLPPAAVREAFNSMQLGGDPTIVEVESVENRTVPGPAGEIPVRIYTPGGDGPFPAVVYFHGGGFVIGNLDTHDPTCRRLAESAKSVVVSVDSRLAPEAKFPAAPEDCYAATKWVSENGAALGVDRQRIAVAGDSAGGNLAAVTALLARERGGPELLHQLLVYPVTDRNFDTDSYHENAEGYLLSRAMMVWFWDLYLEKTEDGEQPTASPLRAADLSGLPSATVLTAGYDPLRDEGRAYAERLGKAGVPTEHLHYPGLIHGFYAMTDQVEEASVAFDASVERLRASLGN